MWKEHNGVGYPSSACAWDVAFVIPVMLHSGPNVESMGTMGVPQFTIFCSIVYDDFTPGWGHRRLVVVEHAMNLAVGAEFGVISGLSE